MKAFLLGLIGLFCLVLKTGVQAQEGQSASQPDLAATRVLLNLGHSGRVSALAYAQSGRVLMSAGGDQQVRLWDVSSRREVHGFSIGVEITHMILFPGEKRLLVAGYDKTVRIVDALSGRNIALLGRHKDDIRSVVLSQDGKRAVSADAEGEIIVWDLTRNKESRRINTDKKLFALAMSPDGLQIAANTYELVTFWDSNSGRELRRLSGFKGGINALAWSFDGQSIAVGTFAHGLHVIDTQSWLTVHQMSTNTKIVGAVVFSPDGQWIATSGAGGEALVEIWSRQTSERIAAFKKPRGVIAHKLSFSPNSKEIATGGAYGAIHSWNLASQEMSFASRSASFSVSAVAQSPGGQWAATSNWDKTLRTWSLIDGRQVNVLRGHTEAVRDIDIHPRDGRVVSGGNDGSIRFWDRKEARTVLQVDQAEGPRKVVRYSPDGSTLASTGVRGSIELIDTKTGQIRGALKGDAESIDDVQFSADNKWLVSVGWDKIIKVWHLATLREERRFEGHTGFVYELAIAPDSDLLASASQDGTVKLWRISTGNLLRSSKLNEDGVFALSFAPGGKEIATGDRAGRLRLWSVQTGALLKELRGHSEAIYSIRFSNDGTRLLSAAGDRTTRYWKVSDASLIVTFVALANDGWLTITPEGYFQSSDYEAAEAINVVQGFTARSLGDFWDVFHRPDLVRKKLAGQDIRQASGGVSLEEALRRPPPRGLEVVLSDGVVQSASSKVTLTIPDSGGGIGEIRLFHNGKLTASWPGCTAPDWMFDRSTLLCRGSVELEWIAGEVNEVALIAFNEGNSIQSSATKSGFQSTLARREPKLWIFSAGINRFDPAQKRFAALVNAANDAQVFSQRLALRAQGIFKAENIHLVGEMAADGAQYLGPLLDEKASRQNILARLDDVARQSRKEDSFVWFMSSHGTLDERGGFGIVPSNIDGEMTKLITSADILAKVKSIKAMTQLLIFDTCHSGALDMQLSGLYDARISRLGKNMGLHLFASAQATEAASDSDGQGHGLFTGQLLAALSDGAADADRNGLLSIKEMGKFAQTKTMERSLRSGSMRGARPVPVDVDGDPVPQRPLMLHFGVDRNLTPSAR